MLWMQIMSYIYKCDVVNTTGLLTPNPSTHYIDRVRWCWIIMVVFDRTHRPSVLSAVIIVVCLHPHLTIARIVFVHIFAIRRSWCFVMLRNYILLNGCVRLRSRVSTAINNNGRLVAVKGWTSITSVGFSRFRVKKKAEMKLG